MFEVNLAHDQGLTGLAAMGAAPERLVWTADKAIDGNTNQDYMSNSCAITNVDENRNTSIWWRVWLQRRFSVAYIEIYFRSDSKYMYIKIISLKFSIFYCVTFCNENCLLIILVVILVINYYYLFSSIYKINGIFHLHVYPTRI